MNDLNAIAAAVCNAKSLIDQLLRTQAAFDHWLRVDIIGRRIYQAHAALLARHLRRELVRAAGRTFRGGPLPIAEAAVEQFIGFCRRHRVKAPLVRVPRSYRGRFGKTLGGYVPEQGWDVSTESVAHVAYWAAERARLEAQP